MNPSVKARNTENLREAANISGTQLILRNRPCEALPVALTASRDSLGAVHLEWVL
jgi:hypothetical protein